MEEFLISQAPEIGPLEQGHCSVGFVCVANTSRSACQDLITTLQGELRAQTGTKRHSHDGMMLFDSVQHFDLIVSYHIFGCETVRALERYSILEHRYQQVKKRKARGGMPDHQVPWLCEWQQHQAFITEIFATSSCLLVLEVVV